jgi:hypothetical protein
MGSRRIKKDANQNVDRDEEASSAKKCLQKVHFSSHPLVDACDLGRPRFRRSSHSAELVPRGTLQQQTWLPHSWQHKHVMTLSTIVHA